MKKIECVWKNNETEFKLTEKFYEKTVGMPPVCLYSYDKKKWYDGWKWDEIRKKKFKSIDIIKN